MKRAAPPQVNHKSAAQKYKRSTNKYQSATKLDSLVAICPSSCAVTLAVPLQ